MTTDIDALAREIVDQIDRQCLDIGGVLLEVNAAKILAAALLAVRNEALEEAAKASIEAQRGIKAENATEKRTGTYITQPYTEWVSGTNIATAIRALKGGT